MIYYLCQYGALAKEIELRKLIVSQAATNRIDEIVSVLLAKNNITIVNCALSKSEEYIEARIESISNKLTIYYPEINPKIKSGYASICDCANYINHHMKSGDCLICYNAHYLTSIIMSKISKKIRYQLVYQIEELYSSSAYYSGIKRLMLKVCEHQMRSKCAASIAVSDSLIVSSLKLKPHMISFGYRIGQGCTDSVSNLNETPLILHTGRLDHDGGIELFLDSIKYINTKCRVVITGTGPLESIVFDFKNTNPNVEYEYLGFVSQEKLDYLLSSAALCVSCLRSDSEFAKNSFPSKVYLYLSHGNYVLSSNVPAVRKLCKVFSNLFIYNGDDCVEIAKKIDHLCDLGFGEKESYREKFDLYYEQQKLELVRFFSEEIIHNNGKE